MFSSRVSNNSIVVGLACTVSRYQIPLEIRGAIRAKGTSATLELGA